ncbi:hypothetical protein BT63DRAFT_10771 [Microthyrium microscopicum]|uniref:MARVEL domain-containing protein n=1 Tax=Microthyrium microscopicum TaxID=703497 RepID=A0A6A6UU57_9PEZI|nr:hypothetical protein BT63DRAFT_10771 [Microthyrium microscopicum]
MAYGFALPLRIAQGFFALLDLILLSYSSNHWANGYRYAGISPSEVNFMIFCSAWTLLAVAFLVLAPVHFETAAHKYAILGVEAVTCIFWFAGWIALAVLLGDIGVRYWTPAQVAAAATAFGAIEWLLFTATTAMAALHVHRTRNHHSNKADPAMTVDNRV